MYVHVCVRARACTAVMFCKHKIKWVGQIFQHVKPKIIF